MTTQTIAIEGYITSLESKIQHKVKSHNERFKDSSRGGFMEGELMSGVEVGLLAEELEMWEKRLNGIKVA